MNLTHETREERYTSPFRYYLLVTSDRNRTESIPPKWAARPEGAVLQRIDLGQITSPAVAFTRYLKAQGNNVWHMAYRTKRYEQLTITLMEHDVEYPEHDAAIKVMRISPNHMRPTTYGRCQVCGKTNRTPGTNAAGAQCRCLHGDLRAAQLRLTATGRKLPASDAS